MGLYVQQRDLYTSKAASEITSETYYVGDIKELTTFLRGSPSTTTIQGSNAEGRSTAIAETSWSDLTTVLFVSGDGAQMVNIQPGFRWLRCLRSETTEVVLNGRTDW